MRNDIIVSVSFTISVKRYPLVVFKNISTKLIQIASEHESSGTRMIHAPTEKELRYLRMIVRTHTFEAAFSDRQPKLGNEHVAEYIAALTNYLEELRKKGKISQFQVSQVAHPK